MEFIKLREHEEMVERAAAWFHEKWDVPLKEYKKSMEESLINQGKVPQWYVAVESGRIIGGLGVIENDFHERRDLAPNVCALYVEEKYRCRGIAGKLLQFVRDDMRVQGIRRLYLVTDHTSFYERYGWKFLCMVPETGTNEWMRMYVYEDK